MYSAFKEIDEVYDAQLSYAAKVLLQLTEHEVYEHKSFRIELGAERPSLSHRYEKNISFRIWRGNHLVTASQSAANFSNTVAPPGFSDQLVGDELWRFFVFVDGLTGITIEVAERYEIRTELIFQIIGSFFAPIFIFLPLLLLLVWLGTTSSLKPLLGVSKVVDLRDANDLTPIGGAHIPIEVMPLIRAINRLLLRLDVSLRREREFTDNAAHELRTPLAAMKTQTQVLLKKDGSIADCHDSLDNLHASIDRAAHLVDQLLSFARLQSPDLDFEPVGMSALCSSIMEDLSPIAIARHQECEADIAENIKVRGNKYALNIIVRNLIDNAIKYTPEGGAIKVELNEQAVLTVTDSGPGIPNEEKAHVTERFRRGNKTGAEGSGLGLAMVKWACDMHGAFLEFSDNTPHGLIVTVKLKS